MATVGETLRAHRKQRGIPLERVASDTRIRREFLEALEEGRVEDLPGSTYVRGFIRAYASFLDLDPGPLLERYAREEEQAIDAGRIAPPPDLVEDLRTRIAADARAARPRRRAVGAFTAVLVFATFALVAWLALTRPGMLRAPAPEAAGRPADARVPAAPEKAPAPGPPAPTRAAGPPASPEPAPETPPLPRPGTEAARPPGPSLRVAESGVGRQIVNRNLAGRDDRFAEGETVWFWTRVVGGRKGDTIRHAWLRDGRLVGVATLAIGGPHWRTYSRRTLEPPAKGRWTVRAVAPDGRVLAEHTFVCE